MGLSLRGKSAPPNFIFNPKRQTSCHSNPQHPSHIFKAYTHVSILAQFLPSILGQRSSLASTTSITREESFISQTAQDQFQVLFTNMNHADQSHKNINPLYISTTSTNRPTCRHPTQAASLRSQRSSPTSKSELPSPARLTPEKQRLGLKMRAMTRRKTP